MHDCEVGVTPLDSVFRDALGDRAGKVAIPAVADLEARFAAGRAAWPEVKVDSATFVKGLAARSDPELPSVAQMPDVYLACACAEGDPVALAAFERHCASDVAAAISRIDSSPSFRDEVMQVLRHQLFLVTERGPGKIAEYAGRAPLRGWVRVVAKRIALNLRRAGAREETDGALATDIVDVAEGAAPELEYMKRLYKEHFDAAIRRAFEALSARDRTLLRLYVAQRMTLAQLGVLCDVSHATVARWLASARGTLISEMRRALGERIALSPSEYESVVALVRSQLDGELLALLQSEGPSAKGTPE